MAVAARELQQQQARNLRAIQPQGQTTGTQAAAHIARLDYERQYQGQELTERELFLILQKKMQEWHREGIPAPWQIDYISGWHAAVLADQQRRETTRATRDIAARMSNFGALLKFLRLRSHIKQQEIADAFDACDCPLDLKKYGKLERNERRSPHFAELAPLYKSLIRAGVEIHSEERAAYLLLARQQMESKKNYKEVVSAKKWEALTSELAAFDDSAPLLLPLMKATPPESAPQQKAAAPTSRLPIAQSPTGQQELLIQAIGEMGMILARLASCLGGGAACQ